MTNLRTLICVAIAIAMLAVACGSDSDVADASAPGDPSAQVMAAAVRELITVDHTFGDGPPPFTEYLLLERTDPAAGVGAGSGASRPLTPAERDAIEAVVAPIGSLQWITVAEDFITDELSPTIEGAAIVGVGEPVISGDSALAPVSLWCGGLCATWLTYTLHANDGGWGVTGIDGPIAIS